MATLETRVGKRGTKYRLIFFLAGRRYAETLAVESAEDAETAKRVAERTLRLLAEGEKTVPNGVDVGHWVATGGKAAHKPTVGNTLPLGGLFEEYVKSVPEGHLEASTRSTMKIHLGHAARILGKGTPLGSLRHQDLQRYINRRSTERTRRGDQISPVTIRKEIATLSVLWSFARNHAKVEGIFPGKDLEYPFVTEAGRFQTWDEIDRQVKATGDEKLWNCLFLNTKEIAELLAHAAKKNYRPYIHPMLVTAAHTGARRSELIRSQVEDIDFKAKVLTIRERKRQRGIHGTRMVPMSAPLVRVLKKWVGKRTSGPTFCHADGSPIDRNDAFGHLESTLAGSKWAKFKGWHVLRHSFASNCAAKGIDQRTIDNWMGHMTESVSRRYRHLFPNQQRDALKLVFG